MKSTRWPSRLLLLLLVAVMPAFAEKISTMPAPTGYIDDYADVLSTSAKYDMEGLCRELHTKTRAQVFLVTIKTLEGESVETFANELFEKWKIGEKKTDRGVLLLFAIKDRKRWIEIGYGFEGILNDAKVGDIGRDMVPALRASDYDGATKIGLQEISKVIAADAGVTLNGLDLPLEEQNQTAPPPVTQAPSSSAIMRNHGPPWQIILIFILFPPLAMAVMFILWLKSGRHIGTSSSFERSDDVSSSSSSGDSGGSDSFSGGDGGSSGGGGAGGDW